VAPGRGVGGRSRVERLIGAGGLAGRGCDDDDGAAVFPVSLLGVGGLDRRWIRSDDEVVKPRSLDETPVVTPAALP